MASKSLHKVQKSIARKHRNTKHKNLTPAALHTHSRDAKRLQRAAARDAKLSHTLTGHQKANEAYLQRVAHFHALARVVASADGTPNPTVFGEEDMRVEVEQFIARGEVKIAVLEGERRQGRPMGREEERVRTRKEEEEREFATGFWVPDLRDEENLRRLREWKGDWVGLNVVRFARVRRDGEIVVSSWPPR